MQLVPYNPIRDLRKLERELDSLWDSDWGFLPPPVDAASMDLYEEDGKLIAEASLPNFKKDEIKVTVEQGILEITAAHEAKEADKSKRHYYFHESNNRYLRRINLPHSAAVDKIDAEFKDGVLKVSIPSPKLAKSNVTSVPIK